MAPGRLTSADAVVCAGSHLVTAPAVSVDDAVLQMELIGHSFYFFTNAATGRAAVLYRRDDGTVACCTPADLLPDTFSF